MTTRISLAAGESGRLLICMPTFNERDNVRPIVDAIFQRVPKSWDILFVDDNSPDGTGDIQNEIAGKNPRVHVLHREGKLGLGTAYMQAFRWAIEHGYDWIMCMDTDFSHDPEYLLEMRRLIDSHLYDVVIGSRYVPGGGVSNWDKRRYLLSQCGSLYSRIWLRHPLRDWTGGFGAWDISALQAIHFETVMSKGYAFQIEMKYRALVLGKRVIEFPIIFKERRSGKSKMSGSIVREALLGVMRLRWRNESGTLFEALKK